MNIQEVFDRFCASIANRKGIMTEDNIRYYWFDAMRAVEGENFDLNHYTMEYPYDSSVFNRTSTGRKELDLLYDDGKDCICMEIKFHRNPDPKSIYAHPDAAGSLFNDLIRLSRFKPGEVYKKGDKMLDLKKRKVQRLFLYVTDAEMDAYLSWDKKTHKKSCYREELDNFYNHAADKVWFQPAFYEISPKGVTKTFKVTALKSFAQKDKEEEIWDKKLYPIPKIRLLNKRDTLTDVCISSPSFKGKFCQIRLYEVKEEI